MLANLPKISIRPRWALGDDLKWSTTQWQLCYLLAIAGMGFLFVAAHVFPRMKRAELPSIEGQLTAIEPSPNPAITICSGSPEPALRVVSALCFLLPLGAAPRLVCFWPLLSIAEDGLRLRNGRFVPWDEIRGAEVFRNPSLGYLTLRLHVEDPSRYSRLGFGVLGEGFSLNPLAIDLGGLRPPVDVALKLFSSAGIPCTDEPLPDLNERWAR